MNKTIFLLLMVFPIYVIAQNITLKGNVIEEDSNDQLPGVTIIVKGTSIGVVSDFEGNFEIETKLGDSIVVSYLGMKTQTLPVLFSPISITMQEEVNQLNEVTVSVGYFDVSKKDLSGSITQISTEQLEKNRTNSIESLIQGQAAGVVVSESSEPGGGIGLTIRGANSMLGGTQPLYVLDGVPVDPLLDAEGNTGAGQSQSSLGFLNPNDIEKIEILKDAAATAVFGARGANGVVLITSKTANKSEGTDKISINYDTSITSVREHIDVLDGPTFERYMNQRNINQLYQNITDPNRTGGPFDGTQAITLENYPELEDFNIPYTETLGVNTNWQDETYRLAHTNFYNLAYRGGNFKRNLSISLGVLDQEGVIVNSNNRRYTYNMNAKRKAFNNKIDIFSKTNISYKKGNAASVGNGEIFSQRGVVSQALQFQPIFSLLSAGEEDDIYASLNEGNVISNPYTLAQYVTDSKKSISLRQVFSVVGKITPKLTATVKGAYDFQRSTRDNYYPTNTTRGRRNDGEASQAFLENTKVYAEANLRYRNKFNKHRIDAILVGTYEKNNFRSLFNRAIGYGSDYTSYYNFASATEIFVPVSNFREVGLLSGLFRVGYNYKRKYYVDLNTRVDASSKFAANNKSAVFPSFALSWVVSKEKFLRKVKAISDLKIRFSFGKTGSNPIVPYQSLALLTPIRYNFNDELVTGNFESNLANDDLTWEKTDQTNLGLNLSLFDFKWNLTVDAYSKLTKDLLQNVNLPVSNGYTSRVDNFGSVENKGIEFSLTGNIIGTDNFTWDISGNIGFNRNKLVELNSNLDYQLGPTVGFSQTNPILFKVGQPLGIFWGAQTDGIYRDWDEAIASGIEGAAPGEIKYLNNYVEFDEAGEPLPLQEINFDDYVKIGDPNPDYTFAITNNFTFKNWDLSILFTGQKGGDLFWVDSWQLSGLQKTTNVLTSSFNDSWIAPLSVEDGTVIYDPAVGNIDNVSHPAAILENGPRAIVSDRQVFDGSFIRLKNINIGYTFNLPKQRNFRIYASGQNVLTWTDYPGYDPEVQTYTKNPQKRGVDFGTYPGTKTYMLGLKFNY
ncbi:SusC/RagA family TonB-linked outer membrane protein [Flavobacteriaceae bacterium]|nr:SusC/RagA family TonB-linked outer membrane protein [Flavobacteriaceae bacterium]